MRYGRKIRWSGDVPVPKVVGNFLKMPQALARPRIQSDKTIGEKVVTQVGHAKEVRFRAAGRDKGNATDLIHCHAGPTIRAVILRPIPGVVTKFAGMRNSMKGQQ